MVKDHRSGKRKWRPAWVIRIGRCLYDPVRHLSHRLLYGGHDPGACARYFGALASWTLGYSDEALALGGEALASAERLAHPF